MCDNPTVADNCSGCAGTGPALFDYWDNNNCILAYQSILNNNNGTLEYNPEGQATVRGLVTNLFNTYLETNELTDNVTSPEYNVFQNTLLNLCINPTLPGVCGDFLDTYCSQYSREDAINSQVLTNFCGCYVPPDPVYLGYTLGSQGCITGEGGCTAGCQAGSTGCTGQPSCDPLCHRALTSQKANYQNGNIITCPENICVIDNVVINSVSTNIPGGINFNNICSGCGGPTGADGCLCIVSGVNVSDTAASVGLGTNFNQFCGPTSVCLIEDSSGNIIDQQPCASAVNVSDISSTPITYLPNIGLITIFIIVLIIVIIVCISARASMARFKMPSMLIEK